MTELRARLEALLGSDAVEDGPAASIDAGLGEIPMVSPTDEDALREVLALARSDGLRVLPLGFGSKLAWCPAPEGADLCLSTRGLGGGIEYEAGDGTLTARAGTPWAELVHVARAGGHHLTPAIPAPTTATLGGVLAAGQSGIDRGRYGPSRHHVLGMRVALADGTLARTGGRLVKNVTGFDLQRLYCGSHGTLCVIVEATLRLFPLPTAQVVLERDDLEPAEALELAEALRAGPVDPWALVVEVQDARAVLTLVLAGRAEAVAVSTDAALAVLGDAEVQRDRRAAATIDALCDRGCERGRWPDLRVGCAPSAVAEALDSLAGRARRVRILPTVAVLQGWLAEDATRPADVETEAAPPPAARMVMERLRASLDPDRLFAPRALVPAPGL